MQATGGCKITSLNGNHLSMLPSLAHDHPPLPLLRRPPYLVSLDSKPTGQASSLCSKIWFYTPGCPERTLVGKIRWATRCSKRAYNDALGPGTPPCFQAIPGFDQCSQNCLLCTRKHTSGTAASETAPNCYPGRLPANEVSWG